MDVSNKLQVTCYYCHKQGHYAKYCPKKINKKIDNLMPADSKAIWEDCKRRKRVPYGFASSLPRNLDLILLIQKYNRTRCGYNKRVESECERIIDRIDREFLQNALKKKDIVKIKKEELLSQKEKLIDRQENKIENEIKKMDKVIMAANMGEITQKEAKRATQQIINDKIERDKKLSQLLDDVFQEKALKVEKELKNIKTPQEMKEKEDGKKAVQEKKIEILNINDELKKMEEKKNEMLKNKTTIEKANIVTSDEYKNVKDKIVELKNKSVTESLVLDMINENDYKNGSHVRRSRNPDYKSSRNNGTWNRNYESSAYDKKFSYDKKNVKNDKTKEVKNGYVVNKKKSEYEKQLEKADAIRMGQEKVIKEKRQATLSWLEQKEEMKRNGTWSEEEFKFGKKGSRYYDFNTDEWKEVTDMDFEFV